MKYFLLLFLIITVVFSCAATTNDSIPELPGDTVLYNSLAKYHQSLLDAQLAEFEIQSKGNWMNFLPSVGIGYTPNGEPRPNMSFSLSQVLTAQRKRETIEAKRRAIIGTAALLQESDSRKLKNLMRQFEMIESEVQFAKTIHEIDIEFFKYYETQQANHDLTAPEFLLKKRDMLIKEQNIRKIELKLDDKRLEILEISHKNGDF